MIKIFCEIMQQYKKSTLLALVTIIILLLLIVAEKLGVMSDTISFIAITGLSLLAIGLGFDAIMKNL